MSGLEYFYAEDIVPKPVIVGEPADSKGTPVLDFDVMHLLELTGALGLALNAERPAHVQPVEY